TCRTTHREACDFIPGPCDVPHIRAEIRLFEAVLPDFPLHITDIAPVITECFLLRLINGMTVAFDVEWTQFKAFGHGRGGDRLIQYKAHGEEVADGLITFSLEQGDHARILYRRPAVDIDWRLVIEFRPDFRQIEAVPFAEQASPDALTPIIRMHHAFTAATGAAGC